MKVARVKSGEEAIENVVLMFGLEPLAVSYVSKGPDTATGETSPCEFQGSRYLD